MNRTLKVIYVLVIILLFGCAGSLGALCIHYNRVPEGIIIISSAVIVLVISIVVALSSSLKNIEDEPRKEKKPKKVKESKVKVEKEPKPKKERKVKLKDATVLMSMDCVLTTYKNDKDVSVFNKTSVQLYDTLGINVQFKKNKSELLSYDVIEDIYKETDDDFCISMPGGVDYKFECSSAVKLMAFEDILNKQTNYRFDDGSDTSSDDA